MAQKNHHSTDSSGKKVYSTSLTFILSTYRVLISTDNNYQLDRRGTEFGDLIGFGKKLIKKQSMEQNHQISQIRLTY